MPRTLVALLLVFTLVGTTTAFAQEGAAAAPVGPEVNPNAPVGTTVTADEEFKINRFELSNAADLQVICSVTNQHPDFDTAHSFCIGFVTGALNYYHAIAAGPNMGGFICTDRPIPRNDIITAFLEWSAAHPDMDSAPAVENLMRAAAAKWPCSAD